MLCRMIQTLVLCSMSVVVAAADRPNILVCISDDQSYPHASAYGYEAISTPAFDRVAEMGVLFTNAFTPAPGCSPMRAAFLTGRNIWQIEHAGTHASAFPKKYNVYPDRLERAGYFVGYTGKPWGPGRWDDELSGPRSRNPAGPAFSERQLKAPGGISNKDYASNFVDFLDQRPKEEPFCFWYGAHEPHRSFAKGIGRAHGMDPAKVKVPPFLPDTLEIRNDLLDYCFEIEWFDRHLGHMLDELIKRGQLDNTLIIVTSDNGMSFPYAKANVTEYGIHMPLAVAWPAIVPGGRTVDDLVNLIDLTATIYDATGVAPPSDPGIVGRSVMNVLRSSKQGFVDASRNEVFSGRERHSSVRYNSLGYPQRSIRTPQYLFIRNFRDERWPAGAPQKYGSGGYARNDEVVAMELGPMHAGYHDIDGCPSLDFLVDKRLDPKIGPFLHLAVDRRPGEELFDIQADPGCINNLADDLLLADVKKRLSDRLVAYLRETNDPRVVGPNQGDIFEMYPRYSPLRWFPEPDWLKRRPQRAPRQPWLEERRPK